MSHPVPFLQLQDYFIQLKDTVFGGTHDFSLVEIEGGQGAKAAVTQYYQEQFDEDDDSIYSPVSEYGIEMLEAPNWEDVLYQICQELHLDTRYEEILSNLEEFLDGGVEGVWHISPKKMMYPEDAYDGDEDEYGHDLSPNWQDILLCCDGKYFLLHFGVLE